MGENYNFFFSKLKNVITSRILKFLIEQSNKKPDEYEKFYVDYGIFLKEGIIVNHDQNEKVCTSQEIFIFKSPDSRYRPR